MTIQHIAQLTGAISVLIFFVIKLVIALTIKGNTKLTPEQKIDHLIAIVLWASLYFLFLFVIRAFSLLGVATLDQLRFISGFSALIPLGGVLFNFWMIEKLGSEKSG